MSRTKKGPGLNAQLKRKRENGEDVDTKPPKRPALDPEAKPKREESPSQDAVLDPALLADHFAKQIRSSFSEASPIELEEMYLPTKAFLDTTSFDKDRVAANLPDFLEQFTPGGKDALSTCGKKGRPHTLVVTSSGIRTADLCRALRVFDKDDCKVAKFIAKHMKLKQNIKHMQEYTFGIAISTPMRFKQLMEADALNTEGLRRIVVDGSHRDEKRNTVFMMDQVFQPLVELLNEASIRSRYGAAQDKVDIVVF